jgi:tRNA (uracil-5-)-methyltransferase
MLSWARQVTANSQGDLLELYCGNGNFSLALAKNFRTVLGTEIAKPSVAAAQMNIAMNSITNVHILRMSAEEFTQALRGERQFQRLADVDLTQLACHTVLVDPPRAGLDRDTLTQLQAYDNIVYISCNPTTLVANLSHLQSTHDIAHAALFDQFPWTPHAEAGVYLVRR